MIVFKERILSNRILIKYVMSRIEKNNKRRYPTNIYLFKFNNRNPRKSCEICSELSIKTHKCDNDVVLVSVLLT